MGSANLNLWQADRETEQLKENYPVFPGRLELLLKGIVLECQKYLSGGTWVMDMEDHEQLAYFPRAPPTKEPCVWEMRDVLERGHYQDSPIWYPQNDKQLRKQYFTLFYCWKLKGSPPK